MIVIDESRNADAKRGSRAVTLPESDSRHEDVKAIVAAAARASRTTAHLLSISRDT